MDAVSRLNLIDRYNIMAKSMGLKEVTKTTVSSVKTFIEKVKYRGALLSDNDGNLIIELSNPVKPDIYEELIFSEEDIYLYREDLSSGVCYGNITLTREQAIIKFSIYNNKLSLLEISKGKDDSYLLEYAGNELLNYLSINSNEVFILDFTGVDNKLSFRLLEELVSSYLGQDIYLKLSKIAVSNASKTTRTLFYDFVERYRGR